MKTIPFVSRLILPYVILFSFCQILIGQNTIELKPDTTITKTLLSELGVGYAHTLSGRKGDIVIQYNIGYKPVIAKNLKLNALMFLEGINTGRTLINFGPKVGLQYNMFDSWKIAGRMGVGLLNNQDQKPGTISWEFNIGYEDQFSLFTKYNSYETSGFANGEYISFGLQMEGMRSLKTTAIVGGATSLAALILSAIISRSQ